MKNLILLLLLSLAAGINAQTPPEPERMRTYDVRHISIDVGFDRAEKMVKGNVTTTIVPLSDNFTDFEVDAVAFKIESILYNNNEVEYDYDGRKIKIKLPRPHSAADTIEYSVKYTCKPQRGLYFIYPTELNPSMSYQIWTQGQQEDNRHWIPIWDYPNDKATSEVYIRVNDSMETISNGYLDYSKPGPGKNSKIDHWVQDKPHPTYLIMLAAGDFSIVADEGSTSPIHSYVDPFRKNTGEYSVRNTRAMMDVYNKLFGYNYPWDNYKQVIVKDFIYGGMENTSATVLNERTYYTHDIETDYSSDNLIAHELTHQWWGDLTTCRNWSEIWLNESFATYGTALWRESYYGDAGKDEYDYYILKAQDEAIKADSTKKRLPIWAGYGDITENVYDKGAAILHTFRSILGDEKFFASIQLFLKEHEFGNVVTQDLIDAVNKTMNDGKDYRWMFEQWIYKAGYPEFEVSYNYNEGSKELGLKVIQVQKLDSLTPVFNMPINLRIKTAHEDRVERIEIMDNNESFIIPLNAKPEFVQFDYGNNFLDKTYIQSSPAQLKSLHAIDRIMYLKNSLIYNRENIGFNEGALLKITGREGKVIHLDNREVSLHEINNILISDRFWGVRVEAAKLLGLIQVDYHPNLKELPHVRMLKDAYDKQTDSRVKREILKALGNFKDEATSKFILKKIKNEKNLYIVADGITALTNVLPPDEVYETVIPYIDVKSHRHVVINAVVDALDSADNYIDDSRIEDALMKVAFGIDIDSRVRTKAITALKKYAKNDEIKSLAKKYADYNFRSTKIALIALLGESGDRSLTPFLQQMKASSTDDSVTKALDAALKKLN